LDRPPLLYGAPKHTRPRRGSLPRNSAWIRGRRHRGGRKGAEYREGKKAISGSRREGFSFPENPARAGDVCSERQPARALTEGLCRPDGRKKKKKKKKKKKSRLPLAISSQRAWALASDFVALIGVVRVVVHSVCGKPAKEFWRSRDSGSNLPRVRGEGAQLGIAALFRTPNPSTKPRRSRFRPTVVMELARGR